MIQITESLNGLGGNGLKLLSFHTPAIDRVTFLEDKNTNIHICIFTTQVRQAAQEKLQRRHRFGLSLGVSDTLSPQPVCTNPPRQTAQGAGHGSQSLPELPPAWADFPNPTSPARNPQHNIPSPTSPARHPRPSFHRHRSRRHCRGKDSFPRLWQATAAAGAGYTAKGGGFGGVWLKGSDLGSCSSRRCRSRSGGMERERRMGDPGRSIIPGPRCPAAALQDQNPSVALKEGKKTQTKQYEAIFRCATAQLPLSVLPSRARPPGPGTCSS